MRPGTCIGIDVPADIVIPLVLSMRKRRRMLIAALPDAEIVSGRVGSALRVLNDPCVERGLSGAAEPNALRQRPVPDVFRDAAQISEFSEEMC